MLPTQVVAVMGITGAGKSSFIKSVTGDQSIKIGHGLESETSSVTGYETRIQGRRFVLVDTPGFNDTYLSDTDVLKMLATWLESSHRRGTKLNAIIYVHPITQTRMHGSALRNFTVFKQLCGEDFYKNITLATSRWSLVGSNIGIRREQELKAHPKFWKPLITLGARVVRIAEGSETAQQLVLDAASGNAASLQVQTEMVDRGLSFSELGATKELNLELESLLRNSPLRKRD